MRGVPLALVLGLVWAAPADAEVTGAVLVLESLTAPLPGQVPEAAPPRFVLMEDRRVFVGGTSGLAMATLEGREVKELERQVSRVRKLSGLGASAVLGEGTERRRLLLAKGPVIVVQGDPAGAPASLRPLAELIQDLERFDHATLQPYTPVSYLLRAREAALPGGCRRWTLSVPLAQAMAAGQVVASAGNWPTGALPASVCDGPRRYAVTHRPLLPGERP
jgi:hypothetical protein